MRDIWSEIGSQKINNLIYAKGIIRRIKLDKEVEVFVEMVETKYQKLEIRNKQRKN